MHSDGTSDSDTRRKVKDGRLALVNGGTLMEVRPLGIRRQGLYSRK